MLDIGIVCRDSEERREGEVCELEEGCAAGPLCGHDQRCHRAGCSDAECPDRCHIRYHCD